MLPLEHPDRIQIAFDDHRLVANAGLMLPATLARRLGLSRLVDRHLDLGDAPGRANTGDKLLTLVVSALAGGDCIDDADALRSGGTASVLGCVVKAPSTLGTFLRSFRWGHVRQLDWVSRANTARGAAHFLRETVGRVRYAGARGQLTVRADSGFYTHSIVTLCRRMKVRFSITIRQHKSLGNLIEAIPEADWTPIPYWMEGAADVAEINYTPFRSKPDAAPVRLIVRRVKPTAGSQLALFASYSYHGFITDRDGETLELEADHRRHAEIENAIRDLKYGVGLNHLPSGRFAANGAWLAVQVMAHNLARWTARIGLGEQIVTTKTLRRRFFCLAGRLTRSAPPPHTASATALALGNPVQLRPLSIASCSISCLMATPVSEPANGQPNVPANLRQPGPRGPLAVSYQAISLATATADRRRCPQKRLQTSRLPEFKTGSSRL